MNRELLVTGALVLVMVLAGCTAFGSLSMAPVEDDDALAGLASRTTDVPDDRLREEVLLAREAIEDGGLVVADDAPPIGEGLPFEHDGAYYRLNRTDVGTVPGVTGEVVIDYNGTVDGETVAYEDLPTADRRALDRLLPQRVDRLSDGWDLGVDVAYNATQRDRSVLLAGEYAGVRFDGEAYPVAVRRVTEENLTVYRYEPQLIAGDNASFSDVLREEYLFAIDGLSDSEREIVEAAIDDTHYVEDSDDEAFESVLETFHAHEPIESSEYRGTWLVEYEGEVYLAELDWDGYTDVVEDGG